MTKMLLIVLITIILIINLNLEEFTGFRKYGFMTEFRNNKSLFPFLPKKNKNI
jgi:hypothetical protein